MWWFGRRRLPAALRPALAHGERVVAWAYEAEGGAVVVATNLGLFLPGDPVRTGWHEIHRAAWDGDRLAVTVAQVRERRSGYQVTVDAPERVVALPTPGTLPRVVRTRVTNSVSHSSHHPVPGGGVRVVARRVPGQDGLRWTVRYDPGTDSDDQEVRERTGELVAQAAARELPPQPPA